MIEEWAIGVNRNRRIPENPDAHGRRRTPMENNTAALKDAKGEEPRTYTG